MPTPQKVPAACDPVQDHIAALAATDDGSHARMADRLAQLEAAADQGCTCATQQRCAHCGLTAVNRILRWLSAPADSPDSPTGQPQQPSLLATLRPAYQPDPRYHNAPLGWVKQLPPRQTGRVGERFVHEFFTGRGLEVNTPDSEGHDLIIDGIHVEVKTSTLWQGTDTFRFSQLRPDADLEVFALVGVTPTQERLWLVDRQALLAAADGQHTGRASKETRWIRIANSAPPRWFGRDLVRHPAGACRRLRTVTPAATAA